VTVEAERVSLYRFVPAVLLLVAVVAGPFRPVARARSRVCGQTSVVQAALSSDATDDGDTARRLAVQVARVARRVTPVWADPSPLVLKIRTLALTPAPLRHLKLPPSSDDLSPD
jgi:hypothetical protein